MIKQLVRINYLEVTSGVITQAQSNTINQKIQIAINKVK